MVYSRFGGVCVNVEEVNFACRVPLYELEIADRKSTPWFAALVGPMWIVHVALPSVRAPDGSVVANIFAGFRCAGMRHGRVELRLPFR